MLREMFFWVRFALKTRLSAFIGRHFSGDTLDYRQVLSIIYPVLIDQGFLVGIIFLNTAMISSSGVAAIGAVSMVDALNLFLINVLIAVATGGTVIIAQYKGRGKIEDLAPAICGSVSSVFAVAMIIALLIGLLHRPLLGFLFGHAEPDVMNFATIYLLGSVMSYLGLAFVESICGALRGMGETRSSLMITLSMNISYVTLNFIFIRFLDMGVPGLVIAMNMARFGAAIFALVYIVRRRSGVFVRFQDFFRVKKQTVKCIFSIGLPFASEQMFFNGGKILTQTFIVRLGTYAIATNAICGSFAALFQFPATALALSIVAVVGQCIGREDMQQARKLVRSFIIMGSGIFALMALIIFPLFFPLLSLFDAPQVIHTDILLIMIINALAQIPLWSLSFVLPAALRTGGDGKFTSTVSMLSMWLFRVVLGYVFGIVLPFGVMGVWLAMQLEWGIRSLIFYRRFRGHRWYQHKLIS